MHAHARDAPVKVHDARGVVDLSRRRVVDREGLDVRERKFGPVALGGLGQVRGETAATGEVRRVEALDVPAPGRGDAAQGEHQAQGRLAGLGGGVREGLPLNRVLVGRDEQRERIAADRLGQAPLDHLRGPGLPLLLEAPLALERLEGLLQDLLGSLAILPAPLAVEVDGIGVKRREQGRLFDGARRAAPVLLCEVRVGELLLWRGLPEKGRIELGRSVRDARDQIGRRGRLEGEEDVRGLDLRAAPGRELDLIGVARLREGRSGLEGAVFLEVEIRHCCLSARSELRPGFARAARGSALSVFERIEN